MGLRRAAESHGARERRAEAEADATSATLTARQRYGIALSKLPQSKLDAVLQRMANDAEAGSTQAIAALARLMGEAWGKPTPDRAPTPEEEGQDIARMK